MPSLYDVSIAVFVRTLGNLDHLLAKAEASDVDAASLVDARLIGDMLPFPKQIQIASDTVRFATVRVGHAEPVSMADDETTLPELRARIAKTIAYLEALDPASFDGPEDSPVVVKFPNLEMTFTRLSYVTDFALPNFFFHVTMAYALLRMKGVALGKMDYLAGGKPLA